MLPSALIAAAFILEVCTLFVAQASGLVDTAAAAAISANDRGAARVSASAVAVAVTSVSNDGGRPPVLEGDANGFSEQQAEVVAGVIAG